MQLPFHAYLEMLSLLAPLTTGSRLRLRSMAGVQCQSRRGGGSASSGRSMYRGVCSNYLAGRRAGETIHATVREKKAGFRLPNDACCRSSRSERNGPRAFPRLSAGARRLESRRGEAWPGDAVLWLSSSRAGLSLRRRTQVIRGQRRRRTAHGFSRAEGSKTYVQNLVSAQKQHVWSLIGQGAIIYVCGDGGKMEPDVKAALVAIHGERTGSDAEAGQQ